ncbi:LapA family protein [Mycobacterium sp. Z3061]|uniref:LapA family protein n=1 Tax=Mycobacterium sp. Z3061 TaxID=3073562 RepID=UPI002872D32F|nr:lipopolysaccharide assembly protein LapA domain-containing protein [Mycobacterium sp. Z3061]
MTSTSPGSVPPDAPLPDHAPSRKTPPPQSRPLPKDKASAFTRAGALWSSLIVGFLVLILLLVFIAQNTAPTAFTFLGWHWTLPLGVAILLAAVVGGLITVAVGTARIIQLRRAAKKNLTAAVR